MGLLSEATAAAEDMSKTRRANETKARRDDLEKRGKRFSDFFGIPAHHIVVTVWRAEHQRDWIGTGAYVPKSRLIDAWEVDDIIVADDPTSMSKYLVSECKCGRSYLRYLSLWRARDDESPVNAVARAMAKDETCEVCRLVKEPECPTCHRAYA